MLLLRSRHDLLRLERVRWRVHRGLVRRGGTLGVGWSGLCLGDWRRRERRGTLRDGGGLRGRNVPRVRTGVLEALVLAASEEGKTDRAMIA